MARRKVTTFADPHPNGLEPSPAVIFPPMIRRQLPVHSPLSIAAVRAAWASSDDDPTPALRARTGAERVVLTDSGTTALSTAISVGLGRRPGRPVALPAYGCFDLVTAARGAGASIVFYDVAPSTLLPDGESLSRAVSLDPSSVVLVHHYGIPVRFAELGASVRASGALLIEDAAQGAGASVDGRPVGTQGDVGILSFGRGKGITAGGGGALLTTEELAVEAERLLGPASADGPVFLARLLAQWVLGRPALYGIPSRLPFLGLGETRYRDPRPCRRIGDRSRRVLMATLPLARDEEAGRRRRVQHIRDALTPTLRARMPDAAQGTEGGWLRLPFRARVAPPAATIGGVRGYPLALPDLPQAREVLDSETEVPGARELVRTLWTLPVHGLVTEQDLERIVQWMRSTDG